MGLVLLLYALFASVFPLGKLVMQYAGPAFVVGSRMTLAGVIMLVYTYFRHPNNFKNFSRKLIIPILLLSVFNIYLTNVFEFMGLLNIASAKASFIYSLSPFLSALMAYLFLGEKMTGKKWLGMAIGFAGFATLLFKNTGTEASVGHLGYLSWSEMCIVIAAVATVIGWIVMKKLVYEKGINPIFLNGMSMLIGGLMAFAHSAIFGKWHPSPVSNWSQFLLFSTILMVISNFICYNLYAYLLHFYTATFMTFAGFTAPFFTAALAWVMLGEVPSYEFWVSVSILLAGLIIFYRGELKQIRLKHPLMLDDSLS